MLGKNPMARVDGMSVVERAKKASAMIRAQLDELITIVERVQTDSDFDRARFALRRWKDRTVRLLKEQVGPREGADLEKSVSWVRVAGQPLRNLELDADRYRGYLVSLLDELKEHPKDIFSTAGSPHEDVPAKISPLEPRVFIIHGRDEANLLKLRQLLADRWELSPIVLRTRAGKGRTIIEKFEDEAKNARYAIALLTPDDFVEGRRGAYSQPRPECDI